MDSLRFKVWKEVADVSLYMEMASTLRSSRGHIEITSLDHDYTTKHETQYNLLKKRL
jgi:hypothetical protein